MRRKKNKKGFTLVEVLAVLVILGILLSIATLAVSNYIQRGKRDYYSSLESNVLASGRDYLLDYRTLYPRVIGNSTVISVDELVKNKYISQPVDEEGKACTGEFVVIKESASKYDYHVCLKCGNTYQSTSEECGYVEEITRGNDFSFTLNGEVATKVLQGHDYSLPTATVKNNETGDIVTESLKPTPNSIDTTRLGDTTVNWRYRNEKVSAKVSVVDEVAPVIEETPKIYYNNGDVYNGEETNRALVVRLKVKDYACEAGSACRLKYPTLEGSGIKAVYYKADNYSSEVKYNTTSNEIKIPISKTSWGKLTIEVEDKAGNRRVAGYVNIHLDSKEPAAPTVTYLKGQSSTLWQKEIEIQLTSSEDIQVRHYEIYVNGTYYGTTGNTWTPPNNFSSNDVKFRAVDLVGNKSTFSPSQKIHMDTESPSKTTVSLNGYTSGSWTNGDVKQTFSATDNGVIDHYEYAYNNTSTTGTSVSNPWTINWDGTWTFYVRAVDQAGNAGPWSDAYIVKRDTVKPSCTVAVTNTPSKYNSYYTSTVNLGIGSTSDDASQVKSSSVNITSISSSTTSSGTKVTGTVTDNANNSNTCTLNIKLDVTTPTISAKSNPISLGTDDYTFTSNVTSNYGIAGGKTTCNPTSTKKTGSYTVTCTATGNNGKTKSVSFTARHSYASSTRTYSCSCSHCKNTTCCVEHYSCDPWACDNCWGSQVCSVNCGTQYFGGTCCSREGTCRTCEHSSDTCSEKYCPNGGTLSSDKTTCVY